MLCGVNTNNVDRPGNPSRALEFRDCASLAKMRLRERAFPRPRSCVTGPVGSCPSWPHWVSCGDIADLTCWGILLAADHLAANLTFGMTARVDGDVPIAAEEIGGLGLRERGGPAG